MQFFRDTLFNMARWFSKNVSIFCGLPFILREWPKQDGVYVFFCSQKMFGSPTGYAKMWHFYKGKLDKIWSKSYSCSNFSHISQNYMPYVYALFFQYTPISHSHTFCSSSYNHIRPFLLGVKLWLMHKLIGIKQKLGGTKLCMQYIQEKGAMEHNSLSMQRTHDGPASGPIYFSLTTINL